MLPRMTGLTGLPNRTLFLDRLSHAPAPAEREEKLVTLLISLNHLKCMLQARILGFSL